MKVCYRCQISDQSFFEGVALAENVLLSLWTQERQLPKLNDSQMLKTFLMEHPQYIFAACLYIASKVHDMTYTALKVFLKVCQVEAEALHADQVIGIPKMFLQSMISGDFLHIETTVLAAIGSQVTNFKQAGKDELATAYHILQRVGQAMGFRECKAASMALFLLYLATFKLGKTFTNC